MPPIHLTRVADPNLLFPDPDPDPIWRIITNPDPTWRVISDPDPDLSGQVISASDPDSEFFYVQNYVFITGFFT